MLWRFNTFKLFFHQWYSQKSISLLYNSRKMQLIDIDSVRIGERFEDTGCFVHVQAFGKKIRTKKQFQTSVIDADVEQRQIDSFYKVGWEYEHSHGIYQTDISNPIFLSSAKQAKSQFPPGFIFYEKNILPFLNRFMTEHSNDTSFRIDHQNYLFQMGDSVNLAYSRGNLKSIFIAILSVISNMKVNLRQISEKYDIEDISYLEIKDIYSILSEWICDEIGEPIEFDQRGKYNVKESVNTIEFLTERSQSLVRFAQYFINIFQQVRDQKRAAILFTQPLIGRLTYLFHPILLGIYANYEKQKTKWQFRKEPIEEKIPHKEKIHGLPLISDTKNHDISRVAFINFDGYQSQFNIELSKNMRHHLLYVSFPKFPENKDSTLHLRYFKKIMFKYTQQLYQNDQDSFHFLSEQGELDHFDLADEIAEKFDRQNNPDDYYTNTNQFYFSAYEKTENTLIFPISFSYLVQEFRNLFQRNSQNISKYESHFIRYFIKKMVGQDIKLFSPHVIVVSYSGRIKILNDHFVEIFQQLTGISKKKIIFFPNLTTVHANSDLNQSQSFNYDNIISDQNITQMLGSQNYPSLQMIAKISRFLKISSGTYSLNTPIEEQKLVSRYKNSKVETYTRNLLKALSEESKRYEKKVNDLLMLTPEILMNKAMEKSHKHVESAVPQFFKKLHIWIRKSIEKMNQAENDYQELFEKFVEQSYINDGLRNIDTIEDPLYLEKLDISDQKEEEFTYIYIKTEQDKTTYETIPTPNKMDNLKGYYMLNFYTRYEYDRICLSIHKHSQLVFKKDQSRQNVKTFNIMMMNHFSSSTPEDGSRNVCSYAGKVRISTSKVVQKERVEMLPIVFRDLQGNIMEQGQNFKVRCCWNYIETSNYYILFWPTLYDHIEATLKKILNLSYEPEILYEIYAAQIPKKKHNLQFYQLNTNAEDFIPRRFCSCLNFNQKVFIFGGFYGQEHNYLQLQNDIISMDFSDFQLEHRKVISVNEKTNIYGSKANKFNSFIRSKRDLQIMSAASLGEEDRQGEKKFILVGGVGQNFTHPHSLMSNYHYELILDQQTKKIKQISRKTAYDQNIIMSNVKGSVKNRGSYQKWNLYDGEENSLKDKDLSADCEVFHQVVYKMEEGKLENKIKTLFAVDGCSQYRGSFHNIPDRLGQLAKVEVGTDDFIVNLCPQGNNFVLIKHKTKVYTKVYFQYEVTSRKFEQVALSHNSILTIDVRHNHIYAIIKHPYYTKDKFTLAYCHPCQLKQQSEMICLQALHTFEEDMHDYVLFVTRKNQVLLLNGLVFDELPLSEYVLKIKKQKPDAQILPSLTVTSKFFRRCYSFFSKQQESIEVKCYNFLISRIKEAKVELVVQQLKMRIDREPGLEWKKLQEEGGVYCFVNPEGELIRINKIIEMRTTFGQRLMIMVSAQSPLLGYLETTNNHQKTIVVSCPQQYKQEWEESMPLPLKIKTSGGQILD